MHRRDYITYKNNGLHGSLNLTKRRFKCSIGTDLRIRLWKMSGVLELRLRCQAKLRKVTLIAK